MRGSEKCPGIIPLAVKEIQKVCINILFIRSYYSPINFWDTRYLWKMLKPKPSIRDPPSTKTFEHIKYFKAIEENPDREFMMAMNYIEIYNEQIRDLLSDSTKKAYITEDESGEVQITNIRQVSH